ncbi:T9SS type A sorting domain-containing protein [Brumimicrobium sp.]|uniref:T9SS type A sorting domain-containing protein n=1 Tax=Brumimicrobium sp. TaxID=2029867 RepID=UPI00261E01E5|nr:T9SS type A sorting domain-containing protein [uncultured Brumimicrobium sp.]
MKALSSLALLMLATFSYAQVCTIDYSQNNPGVYPSVSPNGIKGTTFSQEFTVLFPTADAGVNYSSFQITSVELPMGLTWECSNESTSCVYLPQQDPFACLLISGTPAESGQFEVKINSNAVLANNVETVHTVQFDLEIELSSSSNGVFSISPAMGCETVDVDFTIDNPINYTPIAGQTTGVDYQWSFGNGNSSSFETPVTQTYNGAGTYQVALTQIFDTIGFRLKNVVINNVGCDDAIGYGNPDIYIHVIDADNTVVYSTEPSPNSADLPQNYNMDVLLNNPPYQIRVMDDDSDNAWGTTDDNCINGDENTATTAISLPAETNLGSTTQIGNNGSLNFSYTIEKDTFHIVSYESVTVYSNPAQPNIIVDLNDPLTLSTTDLGHVYHWNMNNTVVPSLRGTEVNPFETGTYSVTAVNEHGCYSTSTDEILDFTHLEELTEIRFNIYPNPANHVVNIDFAETLNLGKVMVTDLSGRTLIQQSIVGQSSLNVDVSALANGVYTISIINESGNLTTKKLIVQ